MGKKGKKPLIPVRKAGKKAEKGRFPGPQGPGKGVFFGLCLGSLKPAMQALWLKPIKSLNSNFQWR